MSCATALVVLASLAQTPRPKSLLIVTFDTTRRDFVGFLGKSPSPTPNLDALAKKSVVFTDAYTVAPLTLPAHASLLTGLYPASHGVHENSAFRLPASAHTLAEILKEHGYATGAAVAADVLDPLFGIAQGFDRYSSPRGPADSSATSLLPERRADQQVEQALADLATLTAKPPFFYWLHFFDPHYPYAAPVHLPATPEELAEKDGAMRHAYVEEIHYADAQLGRLLAQLEAQGFADDLVVVFAADHGESLGDTPESSHGFFLFDPTVRIPLFIRAPGIAPRKIDVQASLIDVVPTVLDVLGVDAPSHHDPTLHFDGIDLAPLMRDASADAPERALLLESWFAWLNYGWAPFDGCVQQSFKYLRSARRELFDRATDPGEKQNRFDPDDARSQSFVRRLQSLLTNRAARLEKDPLQLDADERERLEKLGYSIATSHDDAPHDASGDPSQLPDTYTKAPLIKALEAVTAAQAAGQRERAAELLRALVKDEPKSASLQEQLGLVLMDLAFAQDSQPLLDDAEARLKAALELDVRRGHAHYGIALCAARRTEKLRAEMRAARDRGDPATARRLAPEERTQARRADRAFRDALVFEPGLTDCMMSFARFLEGEAGRATRANDPAGALADWREVAALIDRLLALLPPDETSGAANRRELEEHRAKAQKHVDELEKNEKKDGGR